MLDVLNPTAWVALGALAVPVIIHLLSRGPGTRVAIGSTRFLEDGRLSRARSVRLTHPVLLVVRLLLVAAAVLVLARPALINDDAGHEPEKVTWMLWEPGVSEADLSAADLRLLDSLRAAGAEGRWLAAGFPRMSDATPALGAPPDVWSLLAEADRHLSTNADVVVVSYAGLAGYRGVRPAIGSRITWIDARRRLPQRAIVSARKISADTALVVLAVGDATHTSHGSVIAAIDAGTEVRAVEGVDGLEYDRSANRFMLVSSDAYEPGREAAAQAVPAPESVAILTSPLRAEDGRYVAAAVRAVRGFGEVEVQPIDAGSPRLDSLRVVFWLAEEPVPTGLMERVGEGLVLVRDALSDSAGTTPEPLLMGPEPSHDTPEARRYAPPTGHGVPVWRDASGRPMLERERRGRGSIYRWHARFHPDAGDLVWDRRFPAWIRSLLTGTTGAPGRGLDVRVLPRAQREPVRRPQDGSYLAGAQPRRLRAAAWILLFLLFGVERWLAQRQRA